MSSATVQAKIAAFESLAGPSAVAPQSSLPTSMVFLHANHSQEDSESLLETPISPTTANALPPVVQFPPANSNLPPMSSPPPSPPNLTRKTSLIDLRDWVVEDGSSETTNGIHRPPPLASVRNGRHNENVPKSLDNAVVGIAMPLINLESPPKVKPKPKHLVSTPVTHVVNVPALPPRKPPSLRSVASSSSLQSPSTSYPYPHRCSDLLTIDPGHTYPPKPDVKKHLHAPTSSISSFHSVSLSSDTDPSTPSTLSQHTAPHAEQEHERDLSLKSCGSDSMSLDESYEEVSAMSVASPATERLINLDWERAAAQRRTQPPRLPQRLSAGTITAKPSLPRPLAPKVPPRSTPASPIVRPTLPSSSSTSTLANAFNATSSASRRALPPPSRSSDQSSILSSATTDSSFSAKYATYQSSQNKAPSSQIFTAQPRSLQKTRRPTPIPPKAQKRYEDVFNANVIQRRKADKRRKNIPPLLSPTEARRNRQAVGWRGLSIDLTTGGAGHVMVGEEDNDTDELVDRLVDNDDVLEGRIVRCIWTRSGLDGEKLRGIWDECDISRKGALNRGSFVRGMWRIDEELGRARSELLKHQTSGVLKSRSVRPHTQRTDALPILHRAKAALA
ncbi:hypothetical protein AX15_006302 [Amanita polypyramis BW_CC]|nr:hypothetical protein AX15_006302 [Amanita polypyramis BW_CC]